MKKPLLILFLCAGLSAYSQNSDSSRLFFTKAMAEKAAGRLLVASSLFEKAIQYDQKYADAYIQNGFTLLDMKRNDQAMSKFFQAHQLQPANQQVIKELTQLFFNYRQFNKAIEFALQCTGCENSERITGISYFELEDYSKAEKFLNAALSKNPNDTLANYTMARNYMEREEYNKAIPYYIKAISLDKTRSSWIYELGLLYYNINDYKNAMVAFKSAATQGYVQSGDYNENLGYASLYSGEFDNGEKLLLAIWEKKPGNKDILRDMAEILYGQKQFDRSLIYCQKLMEIDTKDGKALYQAGLCFQKKGDKERGQQMCDKAIQLDPSLDNLRKKKDISGL